MELATSENKRLLRLQLKRRRSALDQRERDRIDEAIAQRVCATTAWRDAQTVYTYLSFGSEIDTRGLIRAAWGEGKAVVLPCCVPHTRTMRWFMVDSFDGLVRSALGMDEPMPDPAREVSAKGAADTIALVPGLAFDRRGYRLGYGGGFYDGFLADFLGTSLGLCRSAFLIDDLTAHGAREPHDLAVDLVVTDGVAYDGSLRR